MRYIANMSGGDVDYFDIEYNYMLRLYKDCRKDSHTRSWCIYDTVTSALFDMILASENIISQAPRISHFTYGRFPYKLILQEEDIGGFIYTIIGKDKAGNEYEVTADYVEAGIISAMEESIKTLAEVMLNDAIVNTEHEKR